MPGLFPKALLGNYASVIRATQVFEKWKWKSVAGCVFKSQEEWRGNVSKQHPQHSEAFDPLLQDPRITFRLMNRCFARPDVPSAEYSNFVRTFSPEELEARLNRQDEQLLLIARTLDRTVTMAEDIHAELGRQGEQLQRIETGLDTTSAALDSGTQRIRSILQRQKEHWRNALLGSGAAGAAAGLALALVVLL